MSRILLSVVLCLGIGSVALGGPVSRPASTSTPAAVVPISLEMMPPAVPAPMSVTRDQGYNGQWYSMARGPLAALRLSGGLAFYPSDSQPVAIYSAAADKTFFVYAGASAQQPAEKMPPRLMISYYDHKTGTVPRPVILLEGLPGTYGSPALALDGQGRLFVFAGFLGENVPGQILRSTRPYDISAWEKVMDMDFRQPQPWSVPGQGFMFLHTRVADEQPRVFFSVSPDGLAWSKPVRLATFGLGQSCISGLFRNKVGVALNYRPEGIAPDERTDLYYIETSDLGKTWQTYPRKQVQMPLTQADNPAKIYDYGMQWRMCLRALLFNPMGNPIVLQIVRPARRTMAFENSRMWTLSRWVGREWETAVALYADSDFDGGDMTTERLAWYVVAPTIPGPQPKTAGGDLVRWKSEDGGRSWYPQRLTHDSTVNQNWPRHPVDAKADLVFLWADGNTRKPSASRIYFADRAGNTYVLPAAMKDESAKPELLWKAPPPTTKPASNPATGTASAPAPKEKP